MGLFGSSKQDRLKRLGVTTASLLVEAARSADVDRVSDLIFGPETTEEGVQQALVFLILLAHEHPDVLELVRDAWSEMPDKADTAFRTGIRCAEVGSASSFQGGSVTGQALFIAVLVRAVALSDGAMRDLAFLRQM